MCELVDVMSCLEDERDVIMDAARDMSTWSAETTRSGDITCCAYVHQGGLFIRANSVFGYCEANRQVSVSTVTFSASRRPLLYVRMYVLRRDPSFTVRYIIAHLVCP